MQCAFCEAGLAPGTQYCPRCGTVVEPNRAWVAPDPTVGAYPGVQQTTSHLAIASMVSGILGWTAFFGIGSIIAIITGHMARAEIRDSGGRIGGDGMAIFGLIAGYSLVALVVLFLAILVVVAGLGLFWTGRVS